MRLLVRMELSLRIVGAMRDPYEEFECVVVRLRKPVMYEKGVPSYLYVDVDLPDRYRGLTSRRNWNPDGTYRVEARLRANRKSLAPFLASSDQEWDVRSNRG
jgi:hypothetical protein